MGRPRNWVAIGLIGLIALAGGTSSTRGADAGRPGTLDPSFGTAGKVFATAPGATAHSEFAAAARQANGDLVFELRREGSPREIEMRTSAGALDASFGDGGRLSVEQGTGLALRGDGGILVGVDRCGEKPSSVMLLDRSGVRVASFGHNGCGASLPFSAALIATDPQGRILLAGPYYSCVCSRNAPPRSEVAVARLLPDGSRDPSFGTDGVARPRARDGAAPPSWEAKPEPTGLAATGDGGAVVSAESRLIRLDQSGTLVAGFGKGGVATLPGAAAGLSVQADGSMVVALTEGRYREGGIAAARYRPDGTLDPSFGGAGIARLPLPTHAAANGISPAPDGKLLVSGEAFAAEGCRPCDATPVLARLTATGQLDPTYGTAGVADLPLLPGGENTTALGMTALLVAPDGSALVAGGRFSDIAFAIARTPDGKAETGFGAAGVLVEPKYVPARLEATGLVLDPSGELTVAAAGSAGTVGSRGFLLGFSADGGQSAGPTGLGVVVTRARGEILPAGPDRVVAWSESIQHSVLAVDSNGRAVRAYGSKGTGAAGFPRGFHPMAVEPAPGGGLAVVGAIGPRAMAVYRLGPSGRPIRSFGDGGLARVIFPRGFAIAFAGLVEPDGGIVLTGWVNNHVAAARLLPNGRLDPRFGKDGLVRGLLGDGAFGSLVAPWGGGVVIATIKKAVPRFASTGLIRLNRHGHLVRGFGQRGVVPPKAKNTPLALLTGGGRIVVVTNPRFERGKRRGVELRAYRADGSPDRGFGDRGLVRADAGKRHQFLPAAAVQQRDGKIVVAGSARYGEGTQVGLMRFR